MKKVGEKMFPKWAREDSKIARFMKDLDPIKIYSVNEFNSFARSTGINNIGQLMNIKVGNHGFGTIIKKTNAGYLLYPELVEAFNLYI